MPAAAAAVERRLTGMLGPPVVTCTRGPVPLYEVPYRYLFWTPVLRPGVLLMVPRGAWSSVEPGSAGTARSVAVPATRRPASAYLAFGGDLPDPRYRPTGSCAPAGA